jgi:predicted nucleic-acid-binding Zn-ribbon protein
MVTDVGICPKCGQQTERGFCHRASGIWYIRPEKLRRFTFKDEDLAKAGWRRILPSKAEYFRAYLCENCKYFAVDFSARLDQKQARTLATEKRKTGPGLGPG